MSVKVYQVIRDRIDELLAGGVVPWRKPWAGGAAGAPVNIRGTRYRGINVFLLAAQGYASPTWITWKQCQAAGGAVLPDERKRSTPVVLWKWIDAKDSDTGENARLPLLRYYRVYNLAQCEGVADPNAPADREPVAPFEAIETAQAIADGYGGAPPVHHGPAGRAFYAPVSDTIDMPERDAFEAPAEYYSTLFHEFAHSTGHRSRLDRPGVTNGAAFASHAYAQEELVAEFAASYLCGMAGIERETLANSAAYISNWRGALARDPRIVVQAAGKAQYAADWIQGRRKYGADAQADGEAEVARG